MPFSSLFSPLPHFHIPTYLAIPTQFPFQVVYIPAVQL